MLINEIMKKTGLSKKAIRFYESKGLIKVTRKSNGYREYSENDILMLNKIKSLRMCGVSVSDIRMLFNDMITMDDLLMKRKKELEDEHGVYNSRFENIEAMMAAYENNEFERDGSFDESESCSVGYSDKIVLGLDIGTTSISASVIDIENMVQIETYTISHGFDVPASQSYFHEQDADAICEKTLKLANFAIAGYDGIKAIGVTGQMHGIVYIDKDGNSLSNLITWQDKRADEKLQNECSYCDEIFKMTGEKVYTGFGFATHYYNCVNNLVPDTAVRFCSIMDYVVMKLTGLSAPIIHNSVAASFGLFDIKRNSFNSNAISLLGMDNLDMPEVTDEFLVVGTFDNIPVSVAIGDNQASFIGSVRNIDDTILVNIGTGSQISMAANDCRDDDLLELRPLMKDKYILCGSALCGGRAYALLEGFFRDYMIEADSCRTSQYDILNRLSYEAYIQNKETPEVMPFFSGRRSDPSVTASVSGMTAENFSPGQFALGFIKGICKELYDFVGSGVNTKKCVVASGNAVSKIPVMKNVIEDTFGLPVTVSELREEASTGAAMFAAAAASL